MVVHNLRCSWKALKSDSETGLPAPLDCEAMICRTTQGVVLVKAKTELAL